MPARREDIANPDRLEVFERYRRLLFSIAYSILGSREEAEESLQETQNHWLQVSHSELAGARAFLVARVASASLERLQATYQLTSSGTSGPVASSTPISTPANSVSRLALMALDALAPEERSAFLLRKMFKCHYSEIGSIIHKDKLECRRIVSKARKSMAKNRSTVDLLKQ